MTVDSEITRIQTAKCCMRQALIDKGVSVASDLSLDCYASCVNAISSGSKGFLKYLLVGGGGGGGGCKYLNYNYIYLGGGGGGAVCSGIYEISNESICVSVGAGGVGSGSSYVGQPGGSTYIGPSDNRVTAPGGQGPNAQYVSNPGCYEAWGGASGSGYVGGRNGNCVICYSSCYGGGGAGGEGSLSGTITGGPGMYGYGGGGGGVKSSTGIDGGGVGGCCGCPNATNCGGGGGGACGNGGGKGGGGLAEICYPSDGSWGINCATGGSKTTVTEGGITYCKHTFTSSGTFCIVC